MLCVTCYPVANKAKLFHNLDVIIPDKRVKKWLMKKILSVPLQMIL